MNKVNIVINGDTISRVTKISWEDRYNDTTKYLEFEINKTESDDVKKVLLEFPEYVAGETATVTNTGLVVFKGVSTSYGYDLIVNNNMSWDSIIPDFTSTTSRYTEFNNPLGVRKIAVNNINGDMKLVGDVYYKSSSNYVFNMDADAIIINGSMVDPESYGWFNTTNYRTNNVLFEYKQSRLIKFYNCKGSVNGVSINENNIVSIDFSDYISLHNSLLFNFTEVNNNAYVEVR